MGVSVGVGTGEDVKVGVGPDVFVIDGAGVEPKENKLQLKIAAAIPNPRIIREKRFMPSLILVIKLDVKQAFIRKWNKDKTEYPGLEQMKFSYLPTYRQPDRL